MKKKLMTWMTGALFLIGSANLMAFPKRGGAGQGASPGSGTCTNCPTGGVPKKDGTGPGWKKGKANDAGGAMKGQRTGPRDGSGPIHTPQGKGGRGRR